MAAENKQSTQISTLDGYPFTGVGGGSQTGRLSGGQNAAQVVQQIEGIVTPTTGSTTGSYYQMCRVPSTAVIKSVEILWTGTSITTFTCDITAAFSDSTIDGTQPSYQVVPSGLTTVTNAYILNPSATTTGLTGAASLFAQGQVIGGSTAGVWTDVTFLKAYTLANSFQPLWQAAGYSSEVGGKIDIVLYETATESLSAAVIAMRVRYTMPTG